MNLFAGGFWTGVVVGAAGGGCLIWFAKDWVMKTVLGAENLAARLRAAADALKK